MKRRNPFGQGRIIYKRARTGYRRPTVRRAYANLVVARPRALAPLATRGYTYPHTGELKAIDTAVTVQVNSTGEFNLLNGCVQGTDFDNRVGRKILIKSIYIRGRVQTEASTGALTTGTNTPAQLVRMIVFVDAQANGAAPTATQLLVTAQAGSQLNLDNRERFRVLIDKQWSLDPVVYNNTATQSVVAASNQMRTIKKYKKCNIETIYNAGVAGTIGDIASNSLYMFWIGSGAAGANTDANAPVSVRIRFNDP